MAGGPGSGKTHVARKLLGDSGLKHVNIDDFYEFLRKNRVTSGGYDKELYDYSWNLLRKRMKLYLDGQLGVIIDITGRHLDRLMQTKKELEDLGYDTMAVMVNTDIKKALDRNEMRARKVDPEMLKRMHSEVQQNIGKIQQIFKGNALFVDNTEDKQDFTHERKMVDKFLAAPNHNRVNEDRRFHIDQAKVGDSLHVGYQGSRVKHLPVVKAVTKNRVRTHGGHEFDRKTGMMRGAKGKKNFATLATDKQMDKDFDIRVKDTLQRSIPRMDNATLRAMLKLAKISAYDARAKGYTSVDESINDMDIIAQQYKTVTEWMIKNCQPWIEAHNSQLTLAYRGLRGNQDVVLPSKGEYRTNRVPTDSPKILHRLFDIAIEEANLVANRSNSIFITGEKDFAKKYGAVYVVFPIGEFNYSWSPHAKDWFMAYHNARVDDFVTVESLSKFTYDWFLQLAKQDPEFEKVLGSWSEDKIVDHFIKYKANVNMLRADDLDAKIIDVKRLIQTVKGDDGTLWQALRSGNEIMLSAKGGYLYVPEMFYWKYMDHYLNAAGIKTH